MKSFLKILMAGIVFLETTGFSAKPEILWFQLKRNFTYKDIDRYCDSIHYSPRFDIGVEVLEGVVKGATLKQGTGDILAHKTAFKSSELSGIQIRKANDNGRWIASLNLSARLLNWVFTEGGASGCTPTQPLASIGPNDFNFEFDLNTVFVHPPAVSSNTGKFWGQRKDGRYYEATLSFTQQFIK